MPSPPTAVGGMAPERCRTRLVMILHRPHFAVLPGAAQRRVGNALPRAARDHDRAFQVPSIIRLTAACPPNRLSCSLTLPRPVASLPPAAAIVTWPRLTTVA